LAITEPLNAKQIATSVPKSRALIDAEAKFAEARARQDEYTGKIRALIAANNRQANNAEITEMSANEGTFIAEVGAAMTRLAPLRTAHAEAIAKALAPYRRDAAQRVVELLADLRPELDVIESTMIEIERAGGRTVRMPPIWLDEITAIARRIVGAA
jgi:hypothetical protein